MVTFNPADSTTYSSQNPATINVALQPGAQQTPVATAVPGSVPNPTVENAMVQTGSAANNQFLTQSNSLQTMLGQLNQQPTEAPRLNVDTYSDSYTKALDEQSKRGSLATKSLIGSIQAQNQNMRNSLGTQYGDYKKGLQLLGIQQNSAQSSPDLLMGHIQQAQNEYVQKIQKLNVEESRAMLDAENARADKDLSTLKEKMNYIKEIQKEKDDALSKTYERMNLQGKIAENQAEMYYDKLQGMNDEDKEDFLIAVSKKYDIPLQALIKGIADVKTARADKAKKSSGGGTSGGYTAQEKRKLRQAGIDTTDIASADDFLYGESAGGDDFYSLADQYAEDPENSDENGYLTAQGFKDLVKQGQKDKVTKANIIERYKDKLYLGKYKFAKNYGFTKAEYDKLTK